MPVTEQQVMANFARAQLAKHAHDEVRRSIRNAPDEQAARRVAAAVLRTPPAYTRHLRVFAFLVCIPGMGKVQARRLLATERLHEQHVLGRLTQRQRFTLAAALDGAQAPPNPWALLA